MRLYIDRLVRILLDKLDDRLSIYIIYILVDRKIGGELDRYKYQ